MTGLHLTVPVACFRKGLAREFFETEPLPPPSTCYGFLLSLVGEEDRCAHAGVRVSAAVLGQPPVNVVLRTLWRVKDLPDGNSQPSANRRPDYQQLLTNVDLIVWLDSGEERRLPTLLSLEERVRAALDPRAREGVGRFGGLSLGESTHLVNDVSLLEASGGKASPPAGDWNAFLLHPDGSHTFPVWVDHVGTRGTRHATGNLEPVDPGILPEPGRLPLITPED